MPEQAKPKPCPICPPDKSDVVTEDRLQTQSITFVLCKCCGLMMRSFSLADAIRLWNTRHEPKDVVALREQADCYTEIAEAVDKLHDDGRTILDCVVMGMSAVEDVAELRADALRFYNADGSHETLDSAEAVKTKRIECAKELAELRTVLSEIAEARGAFSQDPLTFANNVIDDMKQLAIKALAAKGGG